MCSRRWIFLLLIGACSGEDNRPGTVDHPAVPVTEEEPEEPATAEPIEAPEVAEELQEQAAVFEETVERAVEAARGADGAATLCDSAYQSVQAMVEEVAERYPDHVRTMPPRQAFMRLCRDLPPPAQQCLVASYAVENIRECSQVQQSLPADQRERLEELLAGG